MVSGRETGFYGWRVVAAAFVLAVFGWGVGFYSPAIFLEALHRREGWPIAALSGVVTLHFVIGAVVVANLPGLHRRFGVPAVTLAGALLLGLGAVGWAHANAFWQVAAAATFTGAGWVAMGAAAINAILAPWFVRARPAALAMAYNGASIGGVVFAPLWVLLIDAMGFEQAAILIGIVMAGIVAFLALRVFSRTPGSMGQRADGDAPDAPLRAATAADAVSLPGGALWRDRKFITLALGMALSLFAQIGLLAHLFSLMTPAMGLRMAGFAMALATASAIAGRTLVGWLMPAGADRRLFAAASLGVQALASIAFVAAAGSSVPFMIAGIVLFGLGIGNATSLPPLIAQVEFVREETGRVVALIVAMGQGGYAFAPLAFGLVRDLAIDPRPGAAPMLFLLAMAVQLAAILVYLAGRRPRSARLAE